jgi:tetratricopeptide (TPR) repeat protein
MKKRLLSVLFLSLLTHCLFAQDDLDKYIHRLKLSQASGGSETAFMSAGSYFLYGQGYFDNKNYFSAANSFMDAIKADPENPFANYQYAISLIRQNDQYKTELAQTYLQKAFAANPSLKERYSHDVPVAKAAAPEEVKPQGLNGYIQKLKYSRSTGGKETEMNSPGLDAMYGIEYYEDKKYDFAETRFKQSLAKDAANPYVNYLLAVSLAAQNRSAEAAPYLNKATAGDATLQNRFAADAANAKAAWDKMKKAAEPKTTPASSTKAGGQLVFGEYTCHYNRYNGANVYPMFTPQYQGYFLLRSNGTYRWLDNGGEGRYNYNSTTGALTWLSGPLADKKPKSTVYMVQASGNGQATITFNDVIRWECGCEKK